MEGKGKMDQSDVKGDRARIWAGGILTADGRKLRFSLHRNLVLIINVTNLRKWEPSTRDAHDTTII